MNTTLKTLVQALINEINETKGIQDAALTNEKWWMLLDWKTPEYRTLFDSLGEKTRQLITDAGLCPTCGDEDEEEEPPSDTCVCPECGATVERPEDKHCPDVECPECGAAMRAREPGSGGGKGEGGPSEDGGALDFTLIPVEGFEKEDESDVFEVLERARRVLREE